MEKENEKGSGIVRKKRTIWRSAGWTLAAVLLLVNVWAESPEEKEQQPRGYIALTFDDGPSGALTEQLLDGLRQRNARATFFLCGYRMEQYPSALSRYLEEGHELGVHSTVHTDLTKLTPPGGAAGYGPDGRKNPGAHGNFARGHASPRGCI